MRGLVIAGVVALVLQGGGCASGPQDAPEPSAGARTVKFLFSNAEGHFFKGNMSEAVARYSEVIAAVPQSAPAFRGRAAALAVLGREAEALADYGRAVELDPSFDDAWLGRGLYHFARGRYAEAIDDLDRASAQVHPARVREGKRLRSPAARRTAQRKPANTGARGPVHPVVGRRVGAL